VQLANRNNAVIAECNHLKQEINMLMIAKENIQQRVSYSIKIYPRKHLTWLLGLKSGRVSIRRIRKFMS